MATKYVLKDFNRYICINIGDVSDDFNADKFLVCTSIFHLNLSTIPANNYGWVDDLYVVFQVSVFSENNGNAGGIRDVCCFSLK